MLLSKGHAILGDGQMVTGGSGDRAALDGQGMGGEMGYCSWLVSCTLIRLDA